MNAEQMKQYRMWKLTGDKEILGTLLTSLKPSVDAALKSYTGGNEQLRVRALILAKEALESYDPDRKTALNTHVMNHLKRLHRFSAESRSVVHVPENVRMDALKVQRYVDEYKDKHGLEPSDLDVSDNLGMSLGRVARTHKSGAEVAESKQTSEKGDSMTQSGRTVEDIWADYVYHDLDESGRKVFEWTTGYNKQPVLPKGEIAKRLGISPAAVSQRIGTIVKRMEKFDELPQTGPELV